MNYNQINVEFTLPHFFIEIIHIEQFYLDLMGQFIDNIDMS